LYDAARVTTSRFAPAARQAVQRTGGVVVIYEHRLADAVFHADCGGYTAGADAVWGGAPVPYLQPLPDALPPTVHRSWQSTIPAERLRAALNADPRTRVGSRLDGLQVEARDVSGRAGQVLLAGDERRTVRGEDLRAILNQAFGDHTIQSTRFGVSRSGASFLFQGSGFGHGVGLCQVGAAARARRGESLEAILDAYFPGVRLLQAPTGASPRARP
jgi:stage II sporulation protein D